MGNRAFARHLLRPERLGTIPEARPLLRQGQPGSPHRQVRAAALLRSPKKNGYPNRHRSFWTVAVLKDTGTKCRKPLRYKDFSDFLRKDRIRFPSKQELIFHRQLTRQPVSLILKTPMESLLQKAKNVAAFIGRQCPWSLLRHFIYSDKCSSAPSKEISPKSFPLPLH